MKYFTLNPKNNRKVDVLVETSAKSLGARLRLVAKKQITLWKALLVAMFIAGFATALTWAVSEEYFSRTSAQENSTPYVPASLNQYPGPEGVVTTVTQPFFIFSLYDPDQGQAIGYQIQIARDVDFTDLARDYTWSGSIANPNTVQFNVLPEHALKHGSYWWRVRAIDDNGGMSAWAYFGDQMKADFSVDWWDPAWVARRKITFQNAGQNESLTNFPVLVKLNPSRIDYSQTQDQGEDIRFVDADGTTVLAHEIEKWSETGDSFVWVKVPQIDASSNNDFIWLYYGNPTVPDAQSKSAVWSNGYAAVWHLGEVSGVHTDATVNAKNALVIDVSSQGLAAGKVDGADTFSASSTDNIDITDAGNFFGLSSTDSMTVEAWIRTGTSGKTMFIVNKKTGSKDWQLNLNSSSRPQFILYDGSNRPRATSRSGIANNAWHYVVGRWDDSISKAHIFVDGASKASAKNTSFKGVTNTNPLVIGEEGDANRGHNFNGIIDEVRVSKVSRSDAWIAAQYKSMYDSSANPFAIYGQEESSNPSTPDFSLDLNPRSLSVPTETEATFTVSVESMDGFTREVGAWQINNCPVAGACSVQPTSCTTAGYSSCVTVTVQTASLGAGDYFGLSVSGTSGNLAHVSNPVKVSVQATPQTTSCLEVIPGFNNPNENRINIVFMGINFPDVQALAQSLNNYVNTNDGLYGQLFYYEPFKFNKQKFNFWYVNEIGHVGQYTEGYDQYAVEAGPEIDRLTTHCQYANKQEAALINWLFKSGTTAVATPIRPGRIHLSHRVQSPPLNGLSFVHEFGHSFGTLADEYKWGLITITPQQYENCGPASDTSACTNWCSGSPIPVEEIASRSCSAGTDETSCQAINDAGQGPCFWINHGDSIFGFEGCVNWMAMCRSFTDQNTCSTAQNSFYRTSACTWSSEQYPSRSYFKSSCIPTSSKDINIGTACMAGTGCYQACTFSNLFKSVPRGMMRTAGYPFGPVNERALCRKIKESTGSAGGVCTTYNYLPTPPASLSQQTNPGDPALTEGQTASDTTPSFTFTISDPDQGQAIGYQIQISRNADFTDLARDYTWGGSTENPKTVQFDVLPENALASGDYWWRVRGTDEKGAQSAWVYFGDQEAVDFQVTSGVPGGGIGDVNGDSTITTDDAMLVARGVAGLAQLTPQQQEAADANQDSQVTLEDAYIIAGYGAGALGALPASWPNFPEVKNMLGNTAIPVLSRYELSVFFIKLGGDAQLTDQTHVSSIANGLWGIPSFFLDGGDPRPWNQLTNNQRVRFVEVLSPLVIRDRPPFDRTYNFWMQIYDYMLSNNTDPVVAQIIYDSLLQVIWAIETEDPLGAAIIQQRLPAVIKAQEGKRLKDAGLLKNAFRVLIRLGKYDEPSITVDEKNQIASILSLNSVQSAVWQEYQTLILGLGRPWWPEEFDRLRATLEFFPSALWRNLALVTNKTVFENSHGGREFIEQTVAADYPVSEDGAVHELGHVIHSSAPDALAALTELYTLSGTDLDNFVSGYATGNSHEDFASTFGTWIVGGVNQRLGQPLLSTQEWLEEVIFRAKELNKPMVLKKFLIIVDLLSSGGDTTYFYSHTDNTFRALPTREAVPIIRDATGRILKIGNYDISLPPSASFTATPPSGIPPLTVSFDASGSTDTDGTIASYAWNFGDSTAATTKTALHTYTAVGVYTVTLTVTDNQGLTATTTQSVTVTQASVDMAATAVSIPTTGRVGESLPITATVTNFGADRATDTATVYITKRKASEEEGIQFSSCPSQTVTLIANQSETLSCNWTPAVADGPGDYVIEAHIHATHQEWEADWNNNFKGAPITILPAIPYAFQESGGQVVMEAEHFDIHTPRMDHQWIAATTVSGYSGESYMEALPDNGKKADKVTLGPTLSYRVNFITTGTYTVWVRGNAPNKNGDTLHAGLDGQIVTSADNMRNSLWRSTTFQWNKKTSDSAPATLTITTPGIHLIDLGMKEDGMRVDKVLLTTDSAYTPSGTGLGETPRQ